MYPWLVYHQNIIKEFVFHSLAMLERVVDSNTLISCYSVFNMWNSLCPVRSSTSPGVWQGYNTHLLARFPHIKWMWIWALHAYDAPHVLHQWHFLAHYYGRHLQSSNLVLVPFTHHQFMWWGLSS
jgi:hypothetical protein